MLTRRLVQRVCVLRSLQTTPFFFPTSSPSSSPFSSKSPPSDIKKIGVVGLGLMGHGIAQVVSEAGYSVIAVETQQSFLDKGMERIKQSLSKQAEKKVAKGADKTAAEQHVTSALQRLQPSTDLSLLKDCDIVIEAIIENMDEKKKLAHNLGKITKQTAILASNTSSLPIIDIAKASGRASQLVGIHFFNPVQLMGLVEVVRTSDTDSNSFDKVFEFVKTLGKTPVSCKDTPGFIVNRLLVPFLAQALLLLERGDGSIEDIDTAMKLGAGHPMGPIQLADYVGLDTTMFILEGWVQKFPNEKAFMVPEILKKKVAAGKLGRKSGEGFYKWKGDKIVSVSGP